jgi:hypothetical protein
VLESCPAGCNYIVDPLNFWGRRETVHAKRSWV